MFKTLLTSFCVWFLKKDHRKFMLYLDNGDNNQTITNMHYKEVVKLTTEFNKMRHYGTMAITGAELKKACQNN